MVLISNTFALDADHLLLARIVTFPDEAESISIYNPTSSAIDLNNYYLCDDEEYYKIQSEGELAPSHIASGFTAKFPATSIAAGDTITVVLNANYSDYYGDGLIPDFQLYGTETNSMIETESGSFGGSSNKLNEDAEMVILFKWDGNSSIPVQDVDYFLWGNRQNAIDKSAVIGYVSDTAIESQLFFPETAKEYEAYSRNNFVETDETTSGGNGISGHDETNENDNRQGNALQIQHRSRPDRRQWHGEHDDKGMNEGLELTSHDDVDQENRQQKRENEAVKRAFHLFSLPADQKGKTWWIVRRLERCDDLVRGSAQINSIDVGRHQCRPLQIYATNLARPFSNQDIGDRGQSDWHIPSRIHD